MLFDGVYLEESKTALLGERLQRKTTLVELGIVFCFSQSKDTLSRMSFENQTSSTSSRIITEQINLHKDGYFGNSSTGKKDKQSKKRKATSSLKTQLSMATLKMSNNRACFYQKDAFKDVGYLILQRSRRNSYTRNMFPFTKVSA